MPDETASLTSSVERKIRLKAHYLNEVIAVLAALVSNTLLRLVGLSTFLELMSGIFHLYEERERRRELSFKNSVLH